MNYQDRITPAWINVPEEDHLVVVPTNLAGRHGRGLAKKAAKEWGIQYGKAEGKSGKCYLLPTKDGRKKEDPSVRRTLTLDEIKPYIDRLIQFAKDNDHYVIDVTLIGCGNAGYEPSQIAPLFSEAMSVENIRLPKEFWKELGYTTIGKPK
jgi:hypothetical protein